MITTPAQSSKNLKSTFFTALNPISPAHSTLQLSRYRANSSPNIHFHLPSESVSADKQTLPK